MKKSDMFWQTYLNLEKEAIEVSKYVYFTDERLVNGKGGTVIESYKYQLETFSPYLADLLVRCCVQIEAISKELYFDNGGTKSRGDKDLYFDEDCLKLIDKKWQTHKKVVMVVAPFFNFTKDENRILKPLREAHKRQGTYWEIAYQAVKHDRYSSLQMGNIKAFLHALAALYLLNIYYRNDSWVTELQGVSKIDFSLGSSIFTVKPPVTNGLWYGNNPVTSESPYVAKYQDASYQHIEEVQNKAEQATKDYWNKQPELNDPTFQAQLEEAFEREKEDPRQKVIPLWELTKYRLNKMIPDTLPFEKRKALLISSEGWNGWVYQHNKHPSVDELTEDNIQKEIENVAISWGLDIMKRLQKFEQFPFITNSGICDIYIPQSMDTD